MLITRLSRIAAVGCKQGRSLPLCKPLVPQSPLTGGFRGQQECFPWIPKPSSPFSAATGSGEAGPNKEPASSDAAPESGIQTIREDVDRRIDNDSVVEWGKSYCRYSRAAAEALLSVAPKAAVDIVWLDQMKEGPVIQDYLTELTGKTTVPYVFINSEFIGGGDETVALLKSGALVELLEAAGVTWEPEPDQPSPEPQDKAP